MDSRSGPLPTGCRGRRIPLSATVLAGLESPRYTHPAEKEDAGIPCSAAICNNWLWA